MNTKADTAEFAGTGVASDDLDLVHATRSGDVSAFEQLVAIDCNSSELLNRHPHREDSQDAVRIAS